MKVADQVYDLVRPIAEEKGIQVVDVLWLSEGGHWVLRIFIDKPEGVSHADCSEISRAVGEVLDQNDLITKAYHLEVSSPGVERVLKSDRDFQYFKGRRVLVRTKPPFEDQRDWTGELGEMTPEWLSIRVDGTEHRIPRDRVARVRLTLD